MVMLKGLNFWPLSVKPLANIEAILILVRAGMFEKHCQKWLYVGNIGAASWKELVNLEVHSSILPIYWQHETGPWQTCREII